METVEYFGHVLRCFSGHVVEGLKHFGLKLGHPVVHPALQGGDLFPEKIAELRSQESAYLDK